MYDWAEECNDTLMILLSRPHAHDLQHAPCGIDITLLMILVELLSAFLSSLSWYPNLPLALSMRRVLYHHSHGCSRVYNSSSMNNP